MKLRLLSIIAVVFLLSQFSVQADDAAEDRAAADQAKEVKLLQGSWQLESLEFDGKKTVADEIMKLIRWEFKDDALTTIKPNQDGTVIKEPANFKLDVSKSPKYIDLIPLDGPAKGETNKCVYSLEKDVLTLAIPRDKGGDRPTKLTTDKQDGGCQIVVWRRVK